jgi:hypothetical protein
LPSPKTSGGGRFEGLKARPGGGERGGERNWGDLDVGGGERARSVSGFSSWYGAKFMVETGGRRWEDLEVEGRCRRLDG